MNEKFDPQDGTTIILLCAKCKEEVAKGDIHICKGVKENGIETIKKEDSTDH